MDDLKKDIKQMIISSLNLEDMKVDDIEDDIILFSDEGLGLDSVDALELGLAVQKRYGIELDAKTANLKDIFYSVATLSKYIHEQKG